MIQASALAHDEPAGVDLEDSRWPANLHTRHRAYLAERGVDPDRAVAWGVRTVEHSRDLPALPEGVWTAEQRDAIDAAGGFVVTWTSLDEVVSYEAHPDRPRTIARDDKTYTAKFEAPARAPRLHGADVAGVLSLNAALLVTEGMTKAAAAACAARREGIDLIALTVAGCWGALRSTSKDRAPGEPATPPILADHLDFAEGWEGRNVYLAFDGDWRTNASVKRAVQHSARELVARGALVRVIDIPVTTLDPKAGLDDVLARGVSLASLIEASSPPMHSASVPHQRTLEGRHLTIEVAPSSLTSPTFGVDQVHDAASVTSVVEGDLPTTDFGAAERFAVYEGGQWRCTVTPGTAAVTFYHWDGKRWAPAPLADVRRSIVSVARMIHDVESDHHGIKVRDRLLAQAAPGDIEAQKEAIRAGAYAAAEMRYWARTLESGSTQRRIIDELPAVRGITVPADAWDADPLLINTPIGIRDLRRGGAIRPHDPRALMTKITAGSGADVPVSPALQALLDGYAATNPDIPPFMGRLAGAGTTGLSPAIFSHVWGVAGCGKSSLLEALARALGGYAREVGVRVLEERRTGGSDGPTPILHSLRGIRFVYVDEAANAKLDADMLKTLTSGGSMTTRTLHGEGQTWRSQVTVVMSGNGRLRLPDRDPGIARRFYPIRLTERPAVENPGIKADLSSQEGMDAVLAWAIRSAVEWIEEGGPDGSVAALDAPECVLRERASYLGELDPLGTWWDEEVEERSTADEVGAPTTTEVHAAYTIWAKSHGILHIMTDRELIDRITDRGHPPTDRVKRGTTRKRWFDTLRLQGSDVRF